jgi:L,D-transpeptidase ErfK/SrfK
MRALLPILIAIFVLLFSTLVNAKPYGAKLCSHNEIYFCYTVKHDDSWKKLFNDPEERDLVMRINRINTHLYPGMKIAIPRQLESDHNPLSYSPFKMHISPPGEKVILVSLSRLAFGAYGPNGDLQYWGPVSGGRGYCSDIHRGCHSPTGTFAIYDKKGFGCVSTKFPVGRGGAPMPYCMYFHGGFALHGSYEVPGYNASHGCIRMFVNDAQWLNQNFTAEERNVRVIISN